MTKKKPETVNHLLDKPQGDIKALMDQLSKIRSINNSLHQTINPSLSQHCRAVNIRNSTLIIAVDSPIWANKLRFQLPDLLTALRKSGYISLGSIDIIVQP